MNLPKHLALVIMVLLSTQCGSNAAPLDYEFELERLDDQVQELIADLTCETASDCGSIAYGNRPCGGPEEFLVYSTLTVDADALESLVADYNQLDADYNAATGEVSICVMEEEPEIDCIENVCAAAHN